MFEYLEKIRNKPREEKMKITITWAAVLTGVIFLIWITVVLLGSRPQPAPNSNTASEGEGFSNFVKDAGTQLQDIKKEFKNEPDSSGQ